MKKIYFALLLVPLIAATGAEPLYFGNFRSNAPAGLPGVIRTSETTEGFTLQWENKSGKPLSASIFQQQYLEDPEKISFDLKINRNSGSAWNIELKDTASAVFRRQLNLPEADGMFHRIVVPTGEFKKIQSGFPRVSPSDALKEINTLTLVVAGENGAVFDGEIRNFQIHAGDRSIKLFTREFRNIFGESRRYARPIPIRFQNDRVPRVFVADNTSLFCSLPFREAIRRLHQQFKGHLGVHFNGGMHPGVSESAAFYNALGIKTTFENHVTSGYQDYLTSNRLFLTRDDGFSMNDPANWGKPNRYLWPYHGISIFDERAFLPLRATIDEMAKNGISEYLMIDYIWPWRGRWGYDDATREAFRRDLTGEDAGLLYRSSPGEKYRKIGFFDYLRLFTDYRYTPESAPKVSEDISFNTNFYFSYNTAEAVLYYEFAATLETDSFLEDHGFADKITDTTIVYKDSLEAKLLSVFPVTSGIRLEEAVLKAFYMNPEQVTSYTDESGVKTYFDEGRSVRFTPDGKVQYTAPGASGFSFEDVFGYHSAAEYDIYDYIGAALVVADALEPVSGNLGEDITLFLSNIEYDGSTLRLGFGYRCGGIPIFINGTTDILVFELNDGSVQSVSFSMWKLAESGRLEKTPDFMWLLRGYLIEASDRRELMLAYLLSGDGTACGAELAALLR